MMNGFSDEILMAYVDGELEDAERAQIKKALDTDQDIRKRMSVFQATDRRLSKVFELPMNEAPPEHLVYLISRHRKNEQVASKRHRETKGGANAEPTRGARWLSDGLASLTSSFIQLKPKYMMTLATCIAVLIGFGLGAIFNSGTQKYGVNAENIVAFDEGHLFADGLLYRVLETVQTRAGDHRNSSARSIIPILTFRDQQKRYCRQYELDFRSEGQFVGVACRVNNKKWQVIVHVATKIKNPTNDSFVPAAGNGNATVELMIGKMIKGMALNSRQEAALIKNGWGLN